MAYSRKRLMKIKTKKSKATDPRNPLAGRGRNTGKKTANKKKSPSLSNRKPTRGRKKPGGGSG
tara:strand:- start:3 stop:191 length:189 start_codon:yes stop_codon:yes gene_type:complete